MAFTQFDKDMDIIARLSDSPNVDDGLTASQLKAKFDEGGKAVKEYINGTLLQEVAEKPRFTGVLKAENGVFSAAEAGKDYQLPMGNGSVTAEMIGNGVVTREKLSPEVTAAALGGAVPSVAKTVTLAGGGWADKQQTVSVAGVAGDKHMVVTPAAASYVAYAESMVRCVSQAEGGLTFRCEDVPSMDLTVNILIVG